LCNSRNSWQKMVMAFGHLVISHELHEFSRIKYLSNDSWYLLPDPYTQAVGYKHLITCLDAKC
jgi:hypothetical protein